jgi:hypothetical protein
MTALRPALKTALLTLALAGVGTSVWADRNADRNDSRRDQRDRTVEYSTQPHTLHPRGDMGSSFRGIDSSNDWRNRPEFGRPQQRYERNSSNDLDERGGLYRRGYDRVGDNNERHNDAINQRLYDDRRNDSGYHRSSGQRPVNDVIREVQSRYGGQVIGVQNSEGGSMYRVRVLQRDGRVKNVLVPAE